jgi:hypothetical protein
VSSTKHMGYGVWYGAPIHYILECHRTISMLVNGLLYREFQWKVVVAIFLSGSRTECASKFLCIFSFRSLDWFCLFAGVAIYTVHTISTIFVMTKIVNFSWKILSSAKFMIMICVCVHI